MNILLINPSRVYFPGSKRPRVTLPVGILSIAGYLEKHDLSVQICDALISEHTRITNTKDGCIHFGISDDVLIDAIEQARPDIIGISIQFTAQYETAMDTVRLIKRTFLDVPIVVGGAHVTACAEKMLGAHAEIDFALCGEGEIGFYQLVQALQGDRDLATVSGLVYRSGQNSNNVSFDSNDIEYISRLDEIPFPAYHLIDMELFFKQQRIMKGRRGKSDIARSISMITSRGCPYNCIFCSIHTHMGKKYRAHSFSYVLDHIQFVIQEYGVDHIAFDDDNLTFDYTRSKNIFEGIRTRDLRFQWNAPNGVRLDTLDEEMLSHMKSAGCEELTIAPESGSQHTLDTIIEKKLDLNTAVEVARIAQELEIRLNAFYVIGLPGETITAMNETTDFALSLYEKFDVWPSIFSATPLPGTRLYDIVVRKRYIDTPLSSHALSCATQPITGQPIITTDAFTVDDVKRIAHDFNTRRSEIQKQKEILLV